MSTVAVALTFAAITAGNAFEATLDRRALEQAIDIGQSRIEQIRTRFHAPYRTLVGVAPVDYIETVTPFRRVALAAEAHARAGRRIFGQLEAQRALADAPDEIVFHVELTFHPHNTLIGVPGYEVTLSCDGGRGVRVTRTDRIPRFGPRLEPHPLSTPAPPGPGVPLASGLPLTGGTLVVRVSGAELDASSTCTLAIVDAKTTLARARIDLARVR